MSQHEQEFDFGDDEFLSSTPVNTAGADAAKTPDAPKVAPTQKRAMNLTTNRGASSTPLIPSKTKLKREATARIPKQLAKCEALAVPVIEGSEDLIMHISHPAVRRLERELSVLKRDLNNSFLNGLISHTFYQEMALKLFDLFGRLPLDSRFVRYKVARNRLGRAPHPRDISAQFHKRSSLFHFVELLVKISQEREEGNRPSMANFIHKFDELKEKVKDSTYLDDEDKERVLSGLECNFEMADPEPIMPPLDLEGEGEEDTHVEREEDGDEVEEIPNTPPAAKLRKVEKRKKTYVLESSDDEEEEATGGGEKEKKENGKEEEEIGMEMDKEKREREKESAWAEDDEEAEADAEEVAKLEKLLDSAAAKAEHDAAATLAAGPPPTPPENKVITPTEKPAKKNHNCHIKIETRTFTMFTELVKMKDNKETGKKGGSFTGVTVRKKSTDKSKPTGASITIPLNLAGRYYAGVRLAEQRFLTMVKSNAALKNEVLEVTAVLGEDGVTTLDLDRSLAHLPALDSLRWGPHTVRTGPISWERGNLSGYFEGLILSKELKLSQAELDERGKTSSSYSLSFKTEEIQPLKLALGFVAHFYDMPIDE